MKWLAPLLAPLLAAMVLTPFSAARADDGGTPLVVVELFTSQGCSSCPAADKVLTDLAGRDDVLALSLHVDYWDYIGWKDPFSNAAYTRRQRAYAERFKLRYVYTPQMVVHGAQQAVGSNRSEVVDLIDRHRHAPRVDIGLVRKADGSLAVTLPASPLDTPANVWMATFDTRHTTEVRRGENAGRTLTNANVVRDLVILGKWTGRAHTLSVSAQALAAYQGDGAAVVVQTAGKGPVLGAARIALRP